MASRRVDVSSGSIDRHSVGQGLGTPGALSLRVRHLLRPLQAEEMAPTSEFFSSGKFHFISFIIFSSLFFCPLFLELIISQIYFSRAGFCEGRAFYQGLFRAVLEGIPLGQTQ